MALKKADVIENRPVSSSSEEDEVSGSSEEESSEVSESSADENSKKEDSESESDPETLKKEKQLGVASGSAAVTLPKNSSAKRPLNQAEPESAAKKVKISETEHVKEPATDEKAKKISSEDAKKMFQRKFSENDEIGMLQGVLDFISTKGNSEDIDSLCNHIKKLIDFDATKIQIQAKLQRLKRKYLKLVKNALKRGKTEDNIVFSKELDQKAFDLSRKIWGSNGVMTTKANKKLGGKTQTKEIGKPENKVEKTRLFREIDSFFREVNGNACVLDQSTISAYWENVVEGAKKEEMEEKWMKIEEKQAELCLQRIEFFGEVAKMVLKS